MQGIERVDWGRRGWLVLLPFALVPFTIWLPARLQTPARIALLVVALLAWLWLIMRGAGARDAALLANADAGRVIGAWEVLLLAFVVAASVVYFHVASRIAWITTNDGAYYFGVARHIVRSGRFEEPIVWHFLDPPARVLHAPFDYWGGMTSLLLVPVLTLFGDTLRTATLAMTAVTAVSLLAFWYLVCVALPLRYRVTQLLAVVLFAFSPAMDRYRFEPESIPVVHVYLLLALIAYCRRRFALAILLAFCLVLTRGDCFVLFAIVLAAVLLRQVTDGVRSWRRAARCALLGVACIAAYVLWSVLSFGTLTPPGTRSVPFLRQYAAVFDYIPADQRPWRHISDWFAYDYVRHQLSMALATLRAVPYVSPAASDWWLALGMVPALAVIRRPTSAPALIWLLGFAGYFLVAWVAGQGFAKVRAPYTFTPLVVLSGALGIDMILGRADEWLQRRSSTGAAGALVGAAVLAACGLLVSSVPVLQTFQIGTNLPRQHELTKLDSVLRGEAVATNVPWYMIAYTQSPTVSIPFNGEAAIEAVLDRYAVQWMVIFSSPHSGSRSRPLLDAIVAGKASGIGRFRLERVPVDGFEASVYRVRSAK